MTDSYQRNAEQLLTMLSDLKHQQRVLEADIKLIQHKLSTHVAAGDLDHLKTDSENTYKYDEINFVFSPGRVTYDYSNCDDVIAARENLEELQSTAKALGTAVQKVGTPFWTVRA
jgi:hypothetical protein